MSLRISEDRSSFDSTGIIRKPRMPSPESIDSNVRSILGGSKLPRERTDAFVQKLKPLLVGHMAGADFLSAFREALKETAAVGTAEYNEIKRHLGEIVRAVAPRLHAETMALSALEESRRT